MSRSRAVGLAAFGGALAGALIGIGVYPRLIGPAGVSWDAISAIVAAVGIPLALAGIGIQALMARRERRISLVSDLFREWRSAELREARHLIDEELAKYPTLAVQHLPGSALKESVYAIANFGDALALLCLRDDDVRELVEAYLGESLRKIVASLNSNFVAEDSLRRGRDPYQKHLRLWAGTLDQAQYARRLPAADKQMPRDAGGAAAQP